MLAGALGRAGDVEDVVEQLEREPDAPPERAERRGRAARGERAQLARRLEQPGGLEVAALEVARAWDADVPGIGALEQLPARQCRRRGAEHAQLVGAPVAR